MLNQHRERLDLATGGDLSATASSEAPKFFVAFAARLKGH